jgi:hypothetical protein
MRKFVGELARLSTLLRKGWSMDSGLRTAASLGRMHGDDGDGVGLGVRPALGLRFGIFPTIPDRAGRFRDAARGIRARHLEHLFDVRQRTLSAAAITRLENWPDGRVAERDLTPSEMPVRGAE